MGNMETHPQESKLSEKAQIEKAQAASMGYDAPALTDLGTWQATTGYSGSGNFDFGFDPSNPFQ